jgi:two-component system, cell cycle sensor histidine kinase and response regulator CckA
MDTDNNQNEDKLILVIDDEDMLRDVLKEVLEMVGFSALFASSGREGIQLFEENRNRIQLILMDILMPEMSGLETHKEIKALDPDMKFIFMSGFPDKDALSLRELVGEYVFVKKPFSVKEIVSQIKQVLES